MIEVEQTGNQPNTDVLSLTVGLVPEQLDISSTVLAALMGHESSTITERRYIHLFDRQRTDEAVRQAMASASV